MDCRVTHTKGSILSPACGGEWFRAHALETERGSESFPRRGGGHYRRPVVPMINRRLLFLLPIFLALVLAGVYLVRLRTPRYDVIPIFKLPSPPRNPGPPAIVPVRVTKERAAELVRRAIPRLWPEMVEPKIDVYALSTYSPYAPLGRPVYMVDVQGRVALPPHPLRLPCGVDAHDGRVLTESDPRAVNNWRAGIPGRGPVSPPTSAPLPQTKTGPDSRPTPSF